MIVSRAPGKLFIAGEYAVVDAGEPSVLVAVDRFITASVTESSDAGRVHSTEYGRRPLVWTLGSDGQSIVLDHHADDYVVAAIAVIERLRADRGVAARYFDLTIDSELDDPSGRKLGLGSSAAVTVAVIAALDAFYRLALSRAERFRLALIATIAVSPRASGGDLAASTYGGWLAYRSPDRDALQAAVRERGVSDALGSSAWDACDITPLRTPRSVSLSVGWTGSPASTERLVDGVRRPSTGAEAYPDFLAESRSTVDALIDGITRDDAGTILSSIRQSRRILQRLGHETGVVLETPALAHLCDAAERAGGAGKPSGAGGGDCGIALAGPATAPAALRDGWTSHGISALDLSVFEHPAPAA